MSKLCMIYSTAPHYREGIFTTIDREYDCDWYFGRSKNDIKEIDFSKLKNVHFLKSIGNQKKFYLKIGLLKLLFKKEYHIYFMLGDVRSISDWLFYIFANIFFKTKKIYLWTHGWYGKENKWEGALKLWMYKHVSGVFVYGERAKELLIKEGISSDKMFVIHNSLDYETQIGIRKQLKPTSIYINHFCNNYPVILFIGRLTKVKHLELLVYALKKMKDNGIECNLVLIGNGEEKSNLQNIVSKLNINNNVWFYGATYREQEKAELIYNADVCVSPGNVGLTAMDSMVYGTPVISHDNFAWQMPEFEAIKAGYTGDFFAYQNLESLTEAITRWLTNSSSNRENIRKACFKEIDDFWNPFYQIKIIKKYLV